jgi:myo-inositol 2-dehydrogenase / D-chiro-inositol 1-dehydrogenase
LIGCGRIAERGYVPALARAQGVLLTAVADPVPERCAQAAPGVLSFTTAAELIDARVADALVLATPVAAHLPDARLAAEAGLHVLIEKPPASIAEQAGELAALAPSPWIGFNRRFEPDIRKLLDAANAASRIELSLVLRTRKTSWRSYEVDDDVLLNLGPHAVDLALWIARAQPERVDGQVRKNRVVLVIDLGDRGVARIECAGNRPYRERVDVRSGDRLLARYGRGGAREALRGAAGGRGLASPLVPSLSHQLESFARAVQGASEPDLATDGGPAGLTAAHVLSRQNVSATVFEADGVVGGIAKTTSWTELRRARRARLRRGRTPAARAPCVGGPRPQRNEPRRVP